MLAGYAARRESDASMRVTFLDVGDGRAILIQTPDGKHVLIDAGEDASVLRALGRAMSFYDRTIDLLVLTDTDQASTGGAPDVFARYRVRRAADAGGENKVVERSIANAGAPETILGLNDAIDLGGGASAKVIFVRDGMLALEISYGAARAAILPDGMTGNEENMLAAATDVASDVLLVPHAGAKLSVSDTFLSAAHPAYAVISVGSKNRYGYPDKTTLDAIAGSGARTVETSSGDIGFVSDGTPFRRE